MIITEKFDNPILVTKPLKPDKNEVLKSFEEIIDSGWLTNMGKWHNDLEQKLAEYLKIENISVFNNGTIALIVALKALDLPIGSEIITTPFTFAATPHSIAWNGMKPVFVDIDPITMTLSPESIERAITPKTSAILGVHVYGFPCYVEEIEGIAKKHNLKVIYDAAHAFTTEINGKSICEWGDVTMLSFHATKLFNAIEGGALAFKDKKLGDKIYELRNFGIKKFHNINDIKEGIKNKDIIDEIGINGKMNEFQAAWGIATLKKVKKEKFGREEVSKIYIDMLSDIPGISIPKMPKNVTNSYQYFPILIGKNSPFSRDELYEELLKHNIYPRKYFYPLCSEFACYKESLSSKSDNLPVAHKIANNVLCLPYYSELLENDKVKRICEIIRDAKNEI